MHRGLPGKEKTKYSSYSILLIIFYIYSNLKQELLEWGMLPNQRAYSVISCLPLFHVSRGMRGSLASLECHCWSSLVATRRTCRRSQRIRCTSGSWFPRHPQRSEAPSRSSAYEDPPGFPSHSEPPVSTLLRIWQSESSRSKSRTGLDDNLDGYVTNSCPYQVSTRHANGSTQVPKTKPGPAEPAPGEVEVLILNPLHPHGYPHHPHHLRGWNQVRPLRCSLLTQTSWNRLESRRNKPFRAAGKNHRLQGTARCWEICQDPGTAQVVDVLLLTLFKWHGRSSSGMCVCGKMLYIFKFSRHAMLCGEVHCSCV